MVTVAGGASVSVGNGESVGVNVRVGGITNVIVGVNVDVIVGVKDIVGDITGIVTDGVIVEINVSSGVRVTVGVFCSRTRLAFHNNTIPRQ